MFDSSNTAIQQMCEHLHVDTEFFVQCVQESVVEIHEIEGRVELTNGTVLRLRQLERICKTLDVSLSGALLLLDLTERVEELEDKIRLLRSVR